MTRFLLNFLRNFHFPFCFKAAVTSFSPERCLWRSRPLARRRDAERASPDTRSLLPPIRVGCRVVPAASLGRFRGRVLPKRQVRVAIPLTAVWHQVPIRGLPGLKVAGRKEQRCPLILIPPAHWRAASCGRRPKCDRSAWHALTLGVVHQPGNDSGCLGVRITTLSTACCHPRSGQAEGHMHLSSLPWDLRARQFRCKGPSRRLDRDGLPYRWPARSAGR
jgi:hypothetical protein